MSNRRLSEKDVTSIVRELQCWADGEIGTKLTWEKLEKSYGFSRQALQAHKRIKAAYSLAKLALRNNEPSNKQLKAEDLNKLKTENDYLKSKMASLEKTIEEYEKRWQRIAYHIRAKGYNLGGIDRDITQIPDAKTTLKIISGFDHELPPTGRR